MGSPSASATASSCSDVRPLCSSSDRYTAGRVRRPAASSAPYSISGHSSGVMNSSGAAVVPLNLGPARCVRSVWQHRWRPAERGRPGTRVRHPTEPQHVPSWPPHGRPGRGPHATTCTRAGGPASPGRVRGCVGPRRMPRSGLVDCQASAAGPIRLDENAQLGGLGVYPLRPAAHRCRNLSDRDRGVTVIQSPS